MQDRPRVPVFVRLVLAELICLVFFGLIGGMLFGPSPLGITSWVFVMLTASNVLAIIVIRRAQKKGLVTKEQQETINQ